MNQEQNDFIKHEQESPDQIRDTEDQSPNSFLSRIENEFDWNLIGIASIWIFLFATFFLIFVSY